MYFKSGTASFLVVLTSCAVNENPQAVKVSVSLSSPEVSSGEKIDVSWTSTVSKGCTITSLNGFKKDVSSSGKETLTPDNDDTYTVTCSPSIAGDKVGSSSASVKVHPIPKATLFLSKSQIHLGETSDLTWGCDGSTKANLLLNGVPSDLLSLSGSSMYSPSSDTQFDLTCENALGKKISSSTTLSIIRETEVKLDFDSLELLSSSIDISPLITDCGSSCIYAPFEKDLFMLGEDGIYIATENYKKEIEESLKPKPGKALLTTSRSVSFDFPGSFGYGHRESVNDVTMQNLCDQGFPFASKGSTLSDKIHFIDEIESGRENLGPISQKDQIAFDIEVSSTAISGVVKAGSNASISYKIGNLIAQTEAAYQDFDKAKGKYKLSPNGKNVSEFAPRSTRCELPGGDSSIEIPRPSGAVDTASAYAVAKSYFPEPRLYNINPNMYDPKDSLCTKQPWFRMPASRGEPCYHVSARNINEKPGFVMPGSPRVASGLGIVQCKRYFGALADAYGLGDDWTATAEIQYFITDARFKNGCEGAGCAGKEERTSENDWRFQDIEPARNKCVDRWAGLSWSDYQNRLSAACTSTQLYKDAVAKVVQSNNDAAFANACSTNPVCKNALNAMADLSDKFSPKALSDILDRETAAMNAAKKSGSPYFIPEPKLAPQFIAAAESQLSSIEAGIDTVRILHATQSSNWVAANGRVHKRANVAGFDSYQETKDTIASYKKQFDRVGPLIYIDLREISCTYDAKGRFRKYDKPKVNGDVILTTGKQNSFKTTVKIDTKVPKID